MRKPRSLTAARPFGKGDNRVRIIGGRWRGRRIAFPDGDGLRPTGDRIRETLFNWLMPVLPGACCLDLFAGSGVLGFEALSRGAMQCVLVERNPRAVQCLRDAQEILAAGNAQVIPADSVQWLSSARGAFDIVFIDPPFADAALLPAVLVNTLDQRGLLANDPWIYVEQPADAVLQLPQGFVQHRQQRAGQVSYGIWRRAENIP